MNFVDRNLTLKDHDFSSVRLTEGDEFVVSPVDEVRRIWEHALDVAEETAPIVALDYDVVLTKTWLASIAKVWASFPELASLRGEPTQLHLPIDENFYPSKALLTIWQSSVVAMSQEAGVKDVAMPTDRDASREFVRLLKSLVASLGQQARYAETPTDRISKGGRFSLIFQMELCDRFMIVPDQSGEFLSLLHDELATALQNGMPINGAWGSVVLNERGDISYRLHPPEYVEANGFVRAKEIR